MDSTRVEKLYKENCMVVYKANPDIRNGISKLKVIELKKEFKIGELYFNKEYLFQKLIDEFEKELILNRWDRVYFPLRETEEDAKADLFKFAEYEIKKCNEEIKYYNEKVIYPWLKPWACIRKDHSGKQHRCLPHKNFPLE